MAVLLFREGFHAFSLEKPWDWGRGISRSPRSRQVQKQLRVRGSGAALQGDESMVYDKRVCTRAYERRVMSMGALS